MTCRSSQPNATADRRIRSSVPLTAALVLLILVNSDADASAPEREQLQLLVRQIELMERTARQAESVPSTADTRYRFDYQRLLDDIARVRSGIQDYLTPQRAQPRDATELHGDYIRERDDRSNVSCR